MELTLLMAAAVRGARSLRIQGWMAEECEGAALLGLARYKPETTGYAFRRGRLDALDELRRLTGGRQVRRKRKEMWPRDQDGEPRDFAAPDVGMLELEDQWTRDEQRDRIRAWAARRTPRAQCVVEAMLEGRTEAQAGLLLGISESGVSHHLHDSRRARSRP